MHKPTISSLERSLKSLLNQLIHALDNDPHLSVGWVKYMGFRIRQIISRLHLHVGHRRVRRILGSSAAALLLSLGFGAKAQSFAPPVSNPFGLPNTMWKCIGRFGDLDGDGDLDLLAGQWDSLILPAKGELYYYENTGNALNPQFLQAIASPFNLDTDTLRSAYLFPALGDLDGDGDLDIVVGGSSIRGHAFYENIGTAQSPDFDSGQRGVIPLDTAFAAWPCLLDIDADGDLDILTGSGYAYYGNYVFYENIGSVTNAVFANPLQNPFGLVSTYERAYVAAGDVDMDGDLDLMTGELWTGDILYNENIGTATNPQFAASVSNPSNISNNGAHASFPALADLDGDSDVDLLVSEDYDPYTTNVGWKYYENTQSIDLRELESGIEVYPNLVSSKFSIPGSGEFTSVWLSDMRGVEVMRFHHEERIFDIRDLSSGI